ncbi:hypothetical protein Taro_042401 [Colocasia esculenta]|uniref:Uncharacterized protein n=1 Tax=Colocasia esculenta TaxID=4460 RepID=A0A843X2J4_COLES|nr:hypothetical protein [Colocasia esculenta]
MTSPVRVLALQRVGIPRPAARPQRRLDRQFDHEWEDDRRRQRFPRDQLSRVSVTSTTAKRSGGIMGLWNPFEEEVEEGRWIDRWAMSLQFCCMGDSFSWDFFEVYGPQTREGKSPQTREGKRGLCEELLKYHLSSGQPWGVGGDFNAVLAVAEMLGTHFCLEETEDFSNFI